MHASSSNSKNNTGQAVSIIAMAALITGILDASAAMVHSYMANGVTPDRVWKYVASGIAGRAAFTGGSGMVVLGLLCHFVIATIFSILFYFLYQRLSFFSRNIFVTGIIWGLVVWAIMYLIVTPLSNTPPRTLSISVQAVWPQWLIHMFLVGLPMAYTIHRMKKQQQATA